MGQNTLNQRGKHWGRTALQSWVNVVVCCLFSVYVCVKQFVISCAECATTSEPMERHGNIYCSSQKVSVYLLLTKIKDGDRNVSRVWLYVFIITARTTNIMN